MSGSRFALIVTSDTHVDPRLSSLRAPTADADELGRVLRDPDIGAFDVSISHNEPEHVVRRRISAFFDNRGLDDLLVLHMSCHGVKDEDGRLYFATQDTEIEHLDATSVPADFVNRQMTRCRSRRIVLLLLDCCYSGAFARGMVGRGGDRVDIKERFEGRGRIVLTASSAMEYSFEGDQTTGQGRPSVFTSAIVEGLSTGAADRDRDGYVTVDELYDFAFEQVRAVTPSQTPGKWVFDMQGDLHVARSAAGPAADEPLLPTELIAAIASPFARVRRGAVEELGALLANPDRKLAAGAHDALVELTQDDSNEVSRAARRYVGDPGESAPEPPVSAPRVTDAAPPSWAAWACRAAGAALLVGASTPLLIADETTRETALGVLSPFETVLAAVLLWLIATGSRSARVPIRLRGGVLLAGAAVLTAGSVGLIRLSVEGAETAAVVLSFIGLLGALLVGLVGVSLLRVRTATPAPASSLLVPLILSLLGIALVIGAAFVPYDGSDSWWTELEDSSSAVLFAYLPLAAVLLMAAGGVLLRWRRLLAVGMLGASGSLTAAHFIGVLLSATLDVGDVTQVGPMWLVGLAGGILAAVAGWLSFARSAHRRAA